MERIEEASGAIFLGPALVDDAVAHHVFLAVLPGLGGGRGIVWVVVDVADFGFAFGVWGWGIGNDGGCGTGQRWWVGV